MHRALDEGRRGWCRCRRGVPARLASACIGVVQQASRRVGRPARRQGNRRGKKHRGHRRSRWRNALTGVRINALPRVARCALPGVVRRD
eukprot:14579681-Heterocapsa_arctica.AAC.1